MVLKNQDASEGIFAGLLLLLLCRQENISYESVEVLAPFLLQIKIWENSTFLWVLWCYSRPDGWQQPFIQPSSPSRLQITIFSGPTCDSASAQQLNISPSWQSLEANTSCRNLSHMPSGTRLGFQDNVLKRQHHRFHVHNITGTFHHNDME